MRLQNDDLKNWRLTAGVTQKTTRPEIMMIRAIVFVVSICSVTYFAILDLDMRQYYSLECSISMCFSRLRPLSCDPCVNCAITTNRYCIDLVL